MPLRRNFVGFGVVTMAIAATGAVAFFAGEVWGGRNGGVVYAAEAPAAAAAVEGDAVTLTAEQAKTVKLATVEEHDFVPQHETEGFIDFNEDRSVQVFSPWQ